MIDLSRALNSDARRGRAQKARPILIDVFERFDWFHWWASWFDGYWQVPLSVRSPCFHRFYDIVADREVHGCKCSESLAVVLCIPAATREAIQCAGPLIAGALQSLIRSKQLIGNIDVASRCLGIRAKLLRMLHEVLCDRSVDAGDVDGEARAKEEVIAVSAVQMDFGVDRDFTVHDFALARSERDRTSEAGRPAGSE